MLGHIHTTEMVQHCITVVESIAGGGGGGGGSGTVGSVG